MLTEPTWLTGCQECATIIDNGEKPARWWLNDDDTAWLGATTTADACDICMNTSNTYHEIATRPNYGEEQG